MFPVEGQGQGSDEVLPADSLESSQRSGSVVRGLTSHVARAAVLALPEDSGVTAVVAANDVLAVGALSGALLRGWRVPEDLSVTGWDGTQVTAAMTPALTTVTVDDRRLGRNALRHLLTALRGAHAPHDDTPVCTVEWRGSTGPAPVR